MNLKKIVLFAWIGIALFWAAIIIFGFHFYSIDIPTKIPWILALLFWIYLILSMRDKGSRMAINIVFPIFLVLYIPFMWWFGYGLMIGTEGDLSVIQCEKCDKKIITYFHQGAWGGTPLETAGIGDTYLGGLLYKTSVDTTYFAEYYYVKEIDSTILLPKHLKPTDLVLVWQGQNVVLAFEDRKGPSCFPLKYKK